MATSRSQSSERTTRRSSESCSRSYGRQLSKRSRSPADRRADRRKSRSRSRSPSSEEKAHKKHKKHSKKEKKRHKHKKEKKMKQEAENAVPATSFPSVKVEKEEELPVEVTPVDAKSFFEQLQKREAAKEPVGTVHSRGLPAPVSATAVSTSDKWECSKAGCGHMNSIRAPACNKCGAMKRMTEWR